MLIKNEYLEIKNIVNEDMIIADGASVTIRGLVAATILVQTGGELVLHGMATKQVVNNGGDIKVYGMITDTLTNELGSVYIADGAVVNKFIDKTL